MTDLFKDKAGDWDSAPVPAQISAGVSRAIDQTVTFSAEQTVMDFGAGTGLIASRIAPKVARIVAVDVSPSMLEQLAQKPELRGKVEIHCQDILKTPLGTQVDVVVSAMAMHHVQDTKALMRALFDHLRPGGSVALADLDVEKGDFHPPDAEGVYHAGFDREALAGSMREAGFEAPRFATACEVVKEGRRYPIFLVTARKPG